MKYLPFVAAAFLFVGIADLPNGYYTLLRIVVSIIGAILTVIEYDCNKTISIRCIFLGLIVLLFNPIIPVYLQDKDVWTVIDVLVGGVFVYEGVRFIKQQ